MTDKKKVDPKPADANPDPLTGAPGSHPVGVGVGAAGGAAAGAAIGSVGGPVGTVVGTAVGAVAGGLAGKGVAEAINPTLEDEYWRENYDLGDILRRNWSKGLGGKLEGKIHIYVGDMDNYYLNNAVYLVEDFLKTADPPYGGEVDYGDRAEHCWNGDHTRPNAYSRLRYHQMFAPRIVERILKSAPPGADLESWRY